MPFRNSSRSLRRVFWLGLGVGALGWAQAPAAPPKPGAAPAIATVPGHAARGRPGQSLQRDGRRQAERGRRRRICRASTSRNLQSNDVYVIDPATLKVVDKFKVGLNPQHVVPSWDLRTLWVANNAENTKRGSLTPDRSEDRQARQADRRRRSLQHVFLAGRQVGDRRRRGDEAARLPRSADDALQYSIDVPRCGGHQPRRFLDRRPLRDLHLRIHGHRGQDRPRRTARCWATRR